MEEKKNKFGTQNKESKTNGSLRILWGDQCWQGLLQPASLLQILLQSSMQTYLLLQVKETKQFNSKKKHLKNHKSASFWICHQKWLCHGKRYDTFNHLGHWVFEESFPICWENFLEHLRGDVVSNIFKRTFRQLNSSFIEFKYILQTVKLIWSAVK